MLKSYFSNSYWNMTPVISSLASLVYAMKNALLEKFRKMKYGIANGLFLRINNIQQEEFISCYIKAEQESNCLVYSVLCLPTASELVLSNFQNRCINTNDIQQKPTASVQASLSICVHSNNNQSDVKHFNWQTLRKEETKPVKAVTAPRPCGWNFFPSILSNVNLLSESIKNNSNDIHRCSCVQF